MLTHQDNPYHEELSNVGLNKHKLAQRRKQALNAKETKFIKIKGLVDPEKLPRSVKIIASSPEETVLAVSMINWSIRESASKDLQAIYNLYPAAKVDIGNDSITALRNLWEKRKQKDE